MKNIALFKTIRITSMGQAINKTKNKFPHSNITIISASKNSSMYSLFDKVNIIYLDCEPININKTSSDILTKIKNESFDCVIIPTEGNFQTYDNVVNFISKFLNKSKIYYYIYPDSFINYKNIKKNNIYPYIIKMISFLASIIFLFLMFPILIIKSLFNFLRTDK